VMTSTKFRKRTIDIEAVQFTGENGSEVTRWLEQFGGNYSLHYNDTTTKALLQEAVFHLSCDEGKYTLSAADWIVRLPIIGFRVYTNWQVHELFEPADAKPAAPTIKTKIIGDLEWQEEVPDREFTWVMAKTYAASLGDGWRLPTIKELLTLVDYEQKAPACSVFPDCPTCWFWSSSEFCGDATSAWCAHFYYGAVSGREMHVHYRVRCVRDVKEVE